MKKSDFFSIANARNNFIATIIHTSLFGVMLLLPFSCVDNEEKGAPEHTRAELDSLYNKLTDEEKRLPENGLAGLEVAEDLQVQLFAAEPQLLNPTNMDIDAKGRVWITEAYNYRPTLNPQNPQRPEGDRIVILEDTNGDGTADTTKIFYEGTDINAPLGIAVLGNKVIVSCSPNVYVFTDHDGDDIPDKKEVLFTGIGGEQHDHAMHAFTFGPDGKLYFNYGNKGGQLQDHAGNVVIDKDGQEVVADGDPYHQGMVFRSDLDGSGVEVLAHNFRNNYEVAVDSYGTLWQSDNDDDGNRSVRINYVMEYGNYGYNDEMTGEGWRAQRTNMEKEVPFQHWHLNDPGVVPNLIQTGAGSPTGILIYEGDLLPERFHDQIIHADPGHNVIRSYTVQDEGAGYKAEIVDILKGVRDQWFRPSDITVAPDGSLFVADWYDPGVGGHQMGDMNRGRIYRIAPKGTTSYKMPALGFSTAEQAAKALQNPNLAVRYIAWQKLHKMGADAEEALAELWSSEDQRIRARALWLLSKIKSGGDKYLKIALQDSNPDIRITAVRIARQTKDNIIPYLKMLVKDKHPQVRREVAIALRHNKSSEAAGLWADLAMQYNGTDRWYLEALGIGADEQWSKFFNAWRAKTGEDITSRAATDIVWRARNTEAIPLLADLISNSQTTDEDRLRYFRAFDFHQDPSKQRILLGLLDQGDKNATFVNRLVLSHLNRETVNGSPKAQAVLQQILTSPSVRETRHFVNLVDRYQLRNQNDELLSIMLNKPDSSLGIAAAGLLLELGGTPRIKQVFSQNDEQRSLAALRALKKIQSKESMALIQSVIYNPKHASSVRQQAVKSLGWGWSGEEKLLSVVKEGKLPKELEATAATVLGSVYRQSIREEAARYLEVNASKEKSRLAPVTELITRAGVAGNGKLVSDRYCQTCHVIKGKGNDFGPALSEIGDKLPKQAIYESIIHPDAGISFGFEGYTLTLKDGNTVAGIITSESSDEILLKMPGGSMRTYAKAEIVARTKMKSSMMPQLHQSMSEQELVDLVEYLYSLKKSAKNASL